MRLVGSGRALGLAHRLITPGLGVLQQHEHRPLRLDPPVIGDEAGLPTISLVTPSLNQGQFIGETIQSVISQQYPKLQYQIMDGGSSDNTPTVLSGINTADGLSVLTAPDTGQANAINEGHKRTSSQVMGWLNADDLLTPGALLHIGRAFRDHPDLDVVYGHRIVVDHATQEIGRWLLPRHDQRALQLADYIPQETMYWRRSLWDKVGGLDESFRFALDWDLLLRFSEAGALMHRLPHFLGCFRVHEDQLTSTRLLDLGAEEMAALRSRSFGRKVGNREVTTRLLRYNAEHAFLHWRYRIQTQKHTTR